MGLGWKSLSALILRAPLCGANKALMTFFYCFGVPKSSDRILLKTFPRHLLNPPFLAGTSGMAPSSEGKKEFVSVGDFFRLCVY